MNKTILSHTLMLMSFAMLNACVMPQDYAINEVKSMDDYMSSNTFKEIKRIDWPGDTWWERYGDNGLNQLITEALNDSPSIQMAQARLKNARGIARQVGAIKEMQVSGAASASLDKISYGYQAYQPPPNWNDFGSMTLNFSYEFDFWGKNKASIAAASSQLAASKAEEAATRLMLTTSVASSYAELARMESDLGTASSALSVRNKTVNL